MGQTFTIDVRTERARALIASSFPEQPTCLPQKARRASPDAGQWPAKEWPGREEFFWPSRSSPWDCKNSKHHYRCEKEAGDRAGAARTQPGRRLSAFSKCGEHGVPRTSRFPAEYFQMDETEYPMFVSSSALQNEAPSRFPSKQPAKRFQWTEGGDRRPPVARLLATREDILGVLARVPARVPGPRAWPQHQSWHRRMEVAARLLKHTA